MIVKALAPLNNVVYNIVTVPMETKDVLDDMLQSPPGISCPSDWTPSKPGTYSFLLFVN